MKISIGAVLCLLALNANSALIDNGTYTTDDVSGLEWLDLSITKGKSINEVAGQYPTTTAIHPPAGSYSDFRFATSDEVQELYLNIGIELIHRQEIDPILVYTAFDYLGLTVEYRDRYTILHQVGQVIMDEGLTHSMGVRIDTLRLDNPEALVDTTPRDFDYKNNGIGVFLVRGAHVVPIPSAVWLFGSGLIGLVGFARRKKISLCVVVLNITMKVKLKRFISLTHTHNCPY